MRARLKVRMRVGTRKKAIKRRKKNENNNQTRSAFGFVATR